MHVLDLRLQLLQRLFHFVELLLPALPIPLLRLQPHATCKLSRHTPPYRGVLEWVGNWPFVPDELALLCDRSPYRSRTDGQITTIAPRLLFRTHAAHAKNTTAIVLRAPACSGPAAARCAWPWSAACCRCGHRVCYHHRHPPASRHSTSSRCPCSPQPPSCQTPGHVQPPIIRRLHMPSCQATRQPSTTSRVQEHTCSGPLNENNRPP